jgi:hypothetical protein
MVFDDEAGAQYPYGDVERIRSNIVVSQEAYAEAGMAPVQHFAALLISHGHSPEEAAEIVRVAQRSWSKNANWQDCPGRRAVSPPVHVRRFQPEACGQASSSACW